MIVTKLRSFKKEVSIYLGTAFLSVLILIFVMKLWKADFGIPFDYIFGVDVTYYETIVKNMRDTGWYLHNLFLGMPLEQDLHDFYEPGNVSFLLIKLIFILTSNWGLVLNLYFLLAFPLTVMTSLYVFRRFNVSLGLSIIGSLLYAFLPYHFIRKQMHLLLASYYLIPLMVMVILWIARGDSLFRMGHSKFPAYWKFSKSCAAIVICILIGSSGVYYAFFAGFFLFVSGLFSYCSQGCIKSFFSSVVLIMVLSLTLVINLLPMITYSSHRFEDTELGKRSFAEAELYGLKIAQLLLPVTDHRVPYLAKLRENYDKRAPLVNENGSASLGLLGGLGFLFLIGFVIVRNNKISYGDLLRNLGILNISAVLLATIGGFSSLFAYFISPQIRGYNRISIYIAFFSLFAVILLLENLKKRCSWFKSGSFLYCGVLGVIVFVGIVDQTTLSFVPPYERNKIEYISDADFVKRIEKSVPKDSMIFQLPYVPFPENPPVHRMLDYDHFHGYLHSENLRWSYGAMKGREGDTWQREVVAKPLSEMVEILAFAGFNGIYLDRYGYVDSGKEVEEKLSLLLSAKPIVSNNKRLVFFDMTSFNRMLKERYTDEEWRLKEKKSSPAILQK